MPACVETFKRAISIACLVVGIAAAADAATVTLAWDRNPESDIVGYRLSYGTTSGQYTTSIDVGNTTIYTVSNLLAGSIYYFTIQAYNAAGLSPYSNEVSISTSTPLTVTNLMANKASPQATGTAITFSATASGGTAPLQFKWWIIDGTTQTIGSNWSTNSTFVWTPAVASAAYSIRVWARSASSTADAPDNATATLAMSFAITGPATNQPPSVNAGSDQAITLPGSAALSGTVTDDGLPSGTLTRSWTRVSGPGTVTFSAQNAAATNASFSAAGTYVLRLSASDGALSASDDVVVTVNANSIPASGLVAHYRLDDSGGTTASDAAGSNAGTLVNGAAWVPGRHAGAVSFDGTDDYITLPNINASGSGLTVAMWVQTSSFQPSNQQFLSKATDTSEQAHDWMLGLSSGHRLVFRLKTNGVATTLRANNGQLSLNTWYHAAATYDGSRMRLYVNGVEVGAVSKNGAVAMDPIVPLNLGRNPGGSMYMKGALDDVRIYNRALTPAEIGAVMNNP